ncbi:hypothetical protein H7J87_12090 [Mycolicibacterium wolinskyi]|uniref:Uncharacterized protein n=1 Tax=Mycolicibacterium wolinskyi TaxID=59750 RepID=A0A1X2FJ74_9MYCO|nr:MULTISPECIES: hypothetical protein [Mycolicibacterium]MCV7286072.1 hypothetical protein [Mycolicibacterium wolinskyi]MCV7296268.1 hypothetical protein [Mycolicibacterium goodii]ORX18495.1 hypothetical protein AWC31_14430 [Mycolicibacterium wolinskyi]
MPDDFETDPHFINVEGDLGGDDMGVLSRNALNLHLHGCLNSISDGQPGFVSDEYLSALSAETTIAAAELETAGLWERREGGYFVLADEVLKTAIGYSEQTRAREAECADRGRHLPHQPDGSGWIVCTHCGVPTERPDGGPVALPNGGPLGPDPRHSH